MDEQQEFRRKNGADFDFDNHQKKVRECIIKIMKQAVSNADMIKSKEGVLDKEAMLAIVDDAARFAQVVDFINTINKVKHLMIDVLEKSCIVIKNYFGDSLDNDGIKIADQLDRLVREMMQENS